MKKTPFGRHTGYYARRARVEAIRARVNDTFGSCLIPAGSLVERAAPVIAKRRYFTPNRQDQEERDDPSAIALGLRELGR